MKLKKLLPIAAVASTAAIVAPIITACSCATTVKLNNYLEQQDEDPLLLSEKTIEIKKNKKYKALVDCKDWKYEEGVPTKGFWAFIIINKAIISDESTTSEQKDFDVIVNNNKLTYHPDIQSYTDLKQNEFSYIAEGGGAIGYKYMLIGWASSLKADSKITIRVTTPKDMGKMYFAFAFSGDGILK